LSPRFEVRPNSEIDQSSSFSKYSQIHTHPAYTFKDFLRPNIRKDLELLKRYSSTNYDHVMNMFWILSFTHCDKQRYFFHFHLTSQCCPLTSLTDEQGYRTLTHLRCFHPCMDEDRMIMDCTNTHR